VGDRVDRFCDDLRDKLTGIEYRVTNLKAKIDSDRAATRVAIDQQLDEATAALARTKDDAEAARARMISQEQNLLTVGESIAGWKRNREIDKLERRAEDAAANAAWSVLVAVGAIEEAELAALQAIAARLDVEQTATSEGPTGR
jgi:hypothetical protein